MATQTEVGALTERLNDLSGELHSELMDGNGDFSRLRELSHEIAQRAESLATTFGQVDQALAAQLGEGAQADD